MQVEPNMMEILRMGKWREKELLFLQMEPNIKVNGKKDANKVKEL